MKRIQCILMVAALWAGVGVGASSPGSEGDAGEAAPSVDEWVRRLGADSWSEREKATRELWALGEEALPMLEEAAGIADPEVVRRAREIKRKISMGLMPDTPPEIAKMIESYWAAEPPAKDSIVSRQLLPAKAWRQILGIYRAEKDAAVKRRMRPAVAKAIRGAVRDALVAGDEAEALKWLESGPRDAVGLADWAAFHAARGTARAELKRARGVAGKAGALRRMSLLRALGDFSGAGREAEKAGETGIAATMRLLRGDPLPWLEARSKETTSDTSQLWRKVYLKWAVGPREGGGAGNARGSESPGRIFEIDPDLSDPFLGRNSLWRRMEALFAMGAVGDAEKALGGLSGPGVALFFDRQDRLGDAWKALGIGEEKDFGAWAEKRIGKMKDDSGDDDESPDKRKLLILCKIFESRGRGGEPASWLGGTIDDLAKDDPAKLREFFEELLVERVVTAAISAGVAFVSADLSDDFRWHAVFMSIGEALHMPAEDKRLFEWLGPPTEDLPTERRLRVALALTGLLPGETKLRSEWIARLHRDALKAKGPERERLLGLLFKIAKFGGDFDPAFEISGELAKDHPKHPLFGFYLMCLVHEEDWDELLDQTRMGAAAYPDVPEWRMRLAVALRRAGREKESDREERMAGMMAMADAAMCYQFGRICISTTGFDRAAGWWRRVVAETPSGTGEWGRSLEQVRIEALAHRDWKLAAATGEAMVFVRLDGPEGEAGDYLRARFDTDLARAMVVLKKDRKRAVGMLDRCADLLPTDSAPADDFLPAVREAGLLSVHDRCFQRAWENFSEVLGEFPDSPSTCNNAAWIAARALRNLDDAERHIRHALSLAPNNPSCLDTMAEVQFARGEREKAIEWSRRAVRANPIKLSLLRQMARFRTAPCL